MWFLWKKVKVSYMVGTMIEVPRAALLADKIAEEAEFFSFGTNDLTQMTLGLSRDDAGKFLPEYVDEKSLGVFAEDPFQSLDRDGVGGGRVHDHRLGHRGIGRRRRAGNEVGNRHRLRADE